MVNSGLAVLKPQRLPLPSRYYSYAGAVHMHTEYSHDCKSQMDEIIENTNKAGLDYLLISDHDNMGAKEYHGWQGGTLLVIGQEVTTNAGHYLAFNHTEENFLSQNCQDVINEVNSQGGFGFLAHPKALKYSWKDWTAEGYLGIELVNFGCLALEKLAKKALVGCLVEGALSSLFGKFSLLRYLADIRPSRELRKWDELTQKTKVVAVGGIDGHGPLVRGFPTLLDYFRVVRNYILTDKPFTGNGEYDSNLIYEALRKGHTYISYDCFNEGKGFNFFAVSENQKVIMGDEISLKGEVELGIELPQGSRGIIKLLRNGKIVAKAMERKLNYTTNQPGVYRVEVDYKGRFKEKRKASPWIYSNPIYVKGYPEG